MENPKKMRCLKKELPEKTARKFEFCQKFRSQIKNGPGKDVFSRKKDATHFEEGIRYDF